MSTIDVLIIVDTGHALASGNLGTFTLMVDDTNSEALHASNELVTPCRSGQNIQWRAVSVDDGQQLDIVSFQGQAVGSVIDPKKVEVGSQVYWASEVQSRSSGQFQYTCTLNVEGKDMTFDPFLLVSV